MENLSYIKENMNSKAIRNLAKELNLSSKKITQIIKENHLIREPILLKKCPFCNNYNKYYTDATYYKAIKKDVRCKECLIKGRKGNKHFLGKKHTNKTKQKISDSRKGKKLTHSGSFKKGEVHNTKSVYDCWVNKYGKEEADKKWKKYKIKLSESHKGEKNSMYGKPSPIGSGNGWSGWYKGWYFRSLLELSYMIYIIERFNLNWDKGEQKKYRIPYVNEENETRNYFPDFIINDKYIIECKPKNLQGLTINLLKKNAAIDFCKTNNLIYKIRDCRKITINKLVPLYKKGVLKLTSKYENKLLKIINK